MTGILLLLAAFVSIGLLFAICRYLNHAVALLQSIDQRLAERKP
jgi:hypothetical protein